MPAGGYTEKHRAKAEAKFNASIDRTGSCWEWTGLKHRDGYGVAQRVCLDGAARRVLVHRWMFEQANGPIQAGLELDHLCRNRACVNPAHLEPVTHKVNMLRGLGVGSENAAKTHCANGHEFTPENTYHRPRGGRDCRECIRRQQREYQQRLRQRAA